MRCLPLVFREILTLLFPKCITKLDKKNIFFVNERGTKYSEITEEECKDYFWWRYKIREKDDESIIKKFNLLNKNCLSVASGFGPDEILFSQKGNMNVECIEQDPKAVEIHKKMKKELGVDKNIIHCTDMYKYNPDKKYDVIFTSGPSNWMTSSVLQAIPKDFLKFVKENSKDKSYFIARIYGGNYSADYLNLPFFKSTLRKKL